MKNEISTANTTSLKEIAVDQRGFVAVELKDDGTRSTVSKLAKRKHLSKADAAVLEDCIGEIKDAMDEITDSLKAILSLGSSNVNKKFAISNAQTWASAAITDEYTCIDEFSDMKVNPAVKKKIRSSIEKIARQSSNALYLINHLDI